ncbi:MAG: hypothetical protein HFG80_01345 [Eubacterium sp.]|jgi:hypothetical protein|nr:hypothetical protein [Eubacterium sp.]
MKYENIYDRKAYVEQVKNSFRSKEDASFSRKTAAYGSEQEDEIPEGQFSGLKLRIFFSVFLFLAVLLCSVTDYKFYGVSVSDLTKKIEHNYHFENIKEMDFLDFISIEQK